MSFSSILFSLTQTHTSSFSFLSVSLSASVTHTVTYSCPFYNLKRQLGYTHQPFIPVVYTLCVHSVLRMNHLSLSELCCLFCCPPCPSKIASKLAFLPPEPTYSLMCDESGSRWTLHLSERADWQYSAREKDAIECFMTRTSRGNRIACMFVRCSPSARYTLLFSHGNAVDLGQMSSFYIGLGSRINCNVFSYDYSGYGASSGKPSEKNLYADVDAAWQALRTRWDGWMDRGEIQKTCMWAQCVRHSGSGHYRHKDRWIEGKRKDG